MELTIQSLHFTAKSALNEHVTTTVNKLTHFFDKIESADVCLKLENSATDDNKVCEIRLGVPGNDLFAKRHSKSFEEATNDAVDALEQQIKKMKARLENH